MNAEDDPEKLQLRSTLELLSQARDGEKEAVAELYRRHLVRLQRWARARLPREARGKMDTDDLVQDTLMKTLHSLENFEQRHAGAFQAYLRKGVLNRIRDEYRRLLRRPRAADTASQIRDISPSPLEQLIDREKLERYERAIETLGPSDREAVVARLELGLSYGDIARELGKPNPDAARMAVTRGIARLAEAMRRSAEE